MKFPCALLTCTSRSAILLQQAARHSVRVANNLWTSSRRLSGLLAVEPSSFKQRMHSALPHASHSNVVYLDLRAFADASCSNNNSTLALPRSKQLEQLREEMLQERTIAIVRLCSWTAQPRKVFTEGHLDGPRAGVVTQFG